MERESRTSPTCLERRRNLARFATSSALLLGAMWVLSTGSLWAERGKSPSGDMAVEVDVPSVRIEPAPGTQPVRDIGRVRIELVPVPMKAHEMKVTTLEARTGLGTFLRNPDGSTPVWVTETPVFDLEPGHLQFQMRVTNHLGKPLRLQGVAIQFEVDGQPVPVDYALNNLNAAMIMPERSWEGLLHGPDVSLVGRGSTALEGSVHDGGILVGLYDIPSELDDASNITKRSNVEWAYAYHREVLKETAIKRRYKSSLTPQQIKAIANSKQPVPSDQAQGGR